MWPPTRERVAGTRSLSRNARHHRAPNCPCGRPSSGAEQTVLAQGAGDAVGMCAVHVARRDGALPAMADPKYPFGWAIRTSQDGSLAGFLKTKCPHLSVQLVQSSFRPILG